MERNQDEHSFREWSSAGEVTDLQIAEQLVERAKTHGVQLVGRTASPEVGSRP